MVYQNRGSLINQMINKMKKKITKAWFKPVTIKPITNLSWPQAKKRFPLMKPYGDADGDGLKNFRDCKPFDRMRQGKGHGEDMAWIKKKFPYAEAHESLEEYVKDHPKGSIAKKYREDKLAEKEKSK